MELGDPPIEVTGASGNVGRLVVAGLVAAGRDVRALDVDPTRIPTRPGVTGVRFDFTAPTTWEAAFGGARTMFLMRPPQLSNIGRDMVPALEAARRGGIRHMVLLSLQGAERNKVVPHAKLEAWLRDSGAAWTFVRPSFFMENLSTTHAADIRDRSEIVVPAGRGATSFVAARDVADVATVALLDRRAHAGRTWTPTGPRALTYAEVAEILTTTLHRPVRYTRPGVLRYARHARRDLDMPWPKVGVTTAIYSVARFGRAGGVTDDVRAVTERAPTAFEDWARDHAQAWRG